MSLRVEQIRLIHVRVPLHEPFVISSGAVAEKDAILIELRADALTGLGEASPMAGSFYSHHTPDTCWEHLVRQLVPVLHSSQELSPRDFLAATEHLDDPYARCGIETALWDLLARAHGVPLCQALDAAVPPGSVESGLAVGIYPTTTVFLQRIAYHLRRDGYRRIKIKVQPGWDVEPLEAVRRQWPDFPLMVDANGAYRREHIKHIATWDRFRLMMIEQPLPADDLDGHALLARSCRTPICLDESARSPAVVREAIERGAAGIVNIKLQRVGGFAAATEILAIARQARIGCWMGTMPELGVGGWAAVHAAALPNNLFPTDVEASRRWFVDDITVPRIECVAGRISVPTRPGLGIALDDVVVRAHTCREYRTRIALRLFGNR